MSTSSVPKPSLKPAAPSPAPVVPPSQKATRFATNTTDNSNKKVGSDPAQALRKSRTILDSGLEPLNLAGSVTKSIDKKSLQKAKDLEAQKRLPHEAAFAGWKEVSGFEDGDQLTKTDEIMDLLTRSTFLEEYLPEVAYGDWYHTVGILIFGAFFSWFLGRYKFSLGPVFFFTAITALFYRTSIRKYRHKIRIEAQREFSISRIEDDFETMDWLNVFMDKLWIHLEPTAARMVCDIANPILAGLPIPAFIKQIWIATLTVGTKPPRIDKVRTLGRTADDVTVMDWWVSYIPNALEDSTVKQLKNRVNQNVVIKAKMFGLTIPVVVSNASFSAKIRVRLRMMTNFPHIQTVNVSLEEPPKFDFTCKPIGGDSIFSWEILNIPGIFMFINEMIVKYSGPLLFNPLSFELNLEQMLNGNGMNGALGILELNIKEAKGLKGADTFNNTIDPYFTFGFGSNILTKTKVVPDTSDPVFNEKVNVMLKSSAEPLAIVLYDENESDGRKDKFMGAALFDLDEIMDKGVLTDITLPILRNNKEAGEIVFDMKFMKTLQGSKLPDGSYTAPPDLNTGVASLQLLGARSFSKDESKPDSVFTELYVDGELKLTSGAVKGVKEASYNLTVEDIVTDRSKYKVRVLIRENTKAKKIVGSTTLRLTDIIDASYVGNNWFTCAKGNGEVQLACNWSSVELSGVAGTMGYSEPIGVLRIEIEKAKGLINLEKIGVIDPYVRIMINGAQRARTLSHDSTTEPDFYEAMYVPISSPNQRITIEAMDVQRSTPDRTLGSFQIRLNEFIDFNEKGEPIETTMDEVKKGALVHPKKGPHGNVTYSMAFFPSLPVKSPEDIIEEQKAIDLKAKNAAAAAAAAQTEGEAKTVNSSVTTATGSSSEDDEFEEDSKPKVYLPVSELSEYDAGICVFSVMDGVFPKDGYLQIFFDKSGYAAFESPKVGPRRSRINITGDSMIKELTKYSTVTIKLTENKHSNISKQGIKEITIPTKDLIEFTYMKPSIMKIGDDSCKIKIMTRWIPVLMNGLPPADSIGNSGKLSLRLVKANGLPAGDSNGKSDPFVKVYLNGKEQYKSKTIKKTLDPEWNEECSFDVDRRTYSTLRLKVNDWDFGVEQDDELGDVYVSLSMLNPFTGSSWEERVFELTDENDQPAGNITVQYIFTPEYHTLLSAEKQLPNVGGLAVDGAGKVLGAGGKVLGTGVEGAGKVVGGVGKVGGKVLSTAGGLFKKKK